MTNQTVFLVDDDEGSLKSLAWLVSSMGWQARTFTRADLFLAEWNPNAPGCLVLDVRMPGMSGLELQQVLSQAIIAPPIIFVTGHGDIPMSVRAIKSGAVDFLQKPIDDQLLLDRVNAALQADRESRASLEAQQAKAQLLDRLTPREHEVMKRLLVGRTIKEIAVEFGISVQTTAKHRARVLEKMRVQNDVELVRQSLGADLALAEH